MADQAQTERMSHSNRPGEYGIPRDPNSRQYPAFTFRGVTPKDAKAKLPGPGAYEPVKPDALSMRARFVHSLLQTSILDPDCPPHIRSAPKISIAFRPDDPAMREKK